jgi:acetyl esterase/lipase
MVRKNTTAKKKKKKKKKKSFDLKMLILDFSSFASLRTIATAVAAHVLGGAAMYAVAVALRPMTSADAQWLRERIGPKWDAAKLPVLRHLGGGRSVAFSLVIVTFLNGWWTSELTMHLAGVNALCWAAVIGLVADPLTPEACWRAPLLVAGACWALLAMHYVIGVFRGRAALRAALRTGGIEDTRAIGAAACSEVTAAVFAWDLARVVGVVPLPVAVATRITGVTCVRGLPFGDESVTTNGHHRRRKLDAWFPADPARATGVSIMHVHGGAWVSGNRFENMPRAVVEHLVARGVTVVSIDYRLAPRGTLAEMIEDVKLGIATLRMRCGVGGGGGGSSGDAVAAGAGKDPWRWAEPLDPRAIFIMGGSAGGHLSSLAAVTAHDRTMQPGFESHDVSVAGCISMYGAVDIFACHGAVASSAAGTRKFMKYLARTEDDDQIERLCPTARVANREPGAPRPPPMLLIHGDADNLVEVRQSETFARELRRHARGAVDRVVFAQIPWAHHAFDVSPSPRGLLAARAVADFVAHHAREILAQRRPKKDQ